MTLYLPPKKPNCGLVDEKRDQMKVKLQWYAFLKPFCELAYCMQGTKRYVSERGLCMFYAYERDRATLMESNERDRQ